MIAPGLLRSLTALALVPGTALSGAGFTAALGATAFASPAAAQQQPPPPSGPPSDEAVPLVFGEVLDVRVVNVEVVVTDKDGERVRGLGAKDFRLKVDGQEVPIDFFSEILGGAVSPVSAPTTPRKCPPWRPASRSAPATWSSSTTSSRSRATAIACSSASRSRPRRCSPRTAWRWWRSTARS